MPASPGHRGCGAWWRSWSHEQGSTARPCVSPPICACPIPSRRWRCAPADRNGSSPPLGSSWDSFFLDGPKASLHYGQICAALERRGTPIGVNDLHIAAHARSEGLTLVSNNLREFERVEGLLLENWA